MNRGILWYLAIAFGGAWLLWLVPLALGVSAASDRFQLFILPGSFAPAAAAVIVRKWVTCEGFADAGLRLEVRSWRFYLVALLLPLAVVAAIVFEAWLFSIANPDLSIRTALHALARGRPMPPNLPPLLGLIMIPQLLVTSVLITPILWGEEFGWRGYLQPRLFERAPELGALATGVIWGTWHLPLLLRGYQFPGHPLLGALMFPVATCLLSVIFGWLRAAAGSVWAPSLVHAATNAVGGSLTVLWYSGRADPLLTSYLGILGWIPLGALAAWILVTGRLRRSRQAIIRPAQARRGESRHAGPAAKKPTSAAPSAAPPRR